jgi:uroporphyrinogen-III synthase
LVAIGPTTEAALSKYKLKVWSVASKPTPEHLLEAIQK